MGNQDGPIDSQQFSGPEQSVKALPRWTSGKLVGGGIRICDDCGDAALEDEMHLCVGSR